MSLGAYVASMALDNSLDESETDAIALEFSARMQPLEHAEQFSSVLALETDAIIPDVEDILPVFAV